MAKALPTARDVHAIGALSLAALLTKELPAKLVDGNQTWTPCPNCPGKLCARDGRRFCKRCGYFERRKSCQK